MSLPQVVSRDEWLVARKELLAEEKAMTKAGMHIMLGPEWNEACPGARFTLTTSATWRI